MSAEPDQGPAAPGPLVRDHGALVGQPRLDGEVEPAHGALGV